MGLLPFLPKFGWFLKMRLLTEAENMSSALIKGLSAKGTTLQGPFEQLNDEIRRLKRIAADKNSFSIVHMHGAMLKPLLISETEMLTQELRCAALLVKRQTHEVTFKNPVTVSRISLKVALDDRSNEIL